MDKRREILKRTVETTAEKYSEGAEFRAMIQLIPYVGGAIDTLFAGKGAKIQRQRFEMFLQSLDSRLKKIEGCSDIAPDDDFYDFMVGVFEAVVRSKTQTKISRFTALVTNQVLHAQPWDQADTATRILKELEDIHIKILQTVMHTPVCDTPFQGLKVSALTKPLDKFVQPAATPLIKQFPEYPEALITLTCSELVSKGLLSDEGVGRYGTRVLQYFAATKSAEWLFNFIQDH